MTNLMTIRWADFSTVKGASPAFNDLLSEVFSTRKALLAEIHDESVILSVSPIGASPSMVVMSGVWGSTPLIETQGFPVGAQLCLPLLFRAQTILLPFDTFLSVSTEGRTLASFMMRNVLSAIISGLKVQYDSLETDPIHFEQRGRDLSVVYQYLLANEVDEPTLRKQDFHHQAVNAMLYSKTTWQSPLLAAGHDALAACLKHDYPAYTLGNRFLRIRDDVFASFV